NINNSEIIESEKDFYKTSGVSYDPVDRLKRMASKSARQTENTAKDFGFEAISQSRGESAYLIKMGSYIGAFVEEGLGTKNLIAENEPASYYETIAWDTVACIVNDLIAVGAQPVIICPHWAGGSSEFFKNEERNKSMYTGWLKACEFANAIYGPGETSILNDIVHKNSIVMSGSGFGVIKSPQKPTLGQRLAPGDHIVLIESSGIHANGHSLARKIAKEFLPNGYKEKLPSGRSFGEALLTRTHIYSALQKRLFEEKVDIKYMVNITGHGWRKLMRAKSPFTYRIYNIPTSQEEFKLIQEAAGISDY